MRTPSIDQTHTAEIPAIRRADPPAACPLIAFPAAWRNAFVAALVILWLAEGTAAYVLARVWMLLAGWG